MTISFAQSYVISTFFCKFADGRILAAKTMATERRYPVGIQTFERIIKDGYIYVDKTDIVWKLAHYATFIFMSRPRRFGKSLLTSTLDSYFKGDRELFEGLKIMSLEKEWTQYPVLHLDLSITKGQDNAKELRETLMWMMKPLTEVYGRTNDETTPGKLLTGLIHRAKEKTGRQVAVIIDEYDAPLLDVLHSQETLDAMRKVMQEFYVPLKANEAYLKFCFITGITKFSQLSIFSTINNLANVSLEKEFSTICGFTEEELCTTLWPDVELLAAALQTTPEQMHDRLKQRYDGYHFAADLVRLRYADIPNKADAALPHRHHIAGLPRRSRVGLRPAHREYEGRAAAALSERLSHHQGLRPRGRDLPPIYPQPGGAGRLCQRTAAHLHWLEQC